MAICIGQCGLEVTDNGVLQLNLPDFDADATLPCGSEGGGPVFCDGNNELRTLPEHYTESFALAEAMAATEVIAPGACFTFGPHTFTLTNPSDCRPMRALRNVQIDVLIDSDPGVAPRFATTLNGGGLNTRYRLPPQTEEGFIRFAAVTQLATPIIAAGATATDDFALVICNDGTAPMTVLAGGLTIVALGSTVGLI